MIDKKIPKAEKEMKPKTTKSTDTPKKTPVKKLVKGSPEAAAFMQGLRDKKKKK